jgi:hypothetical protein
MVAKRQDLEERYFLLSAIYLLLSLQLLQRT